jgi:hypothetical protein
MKCANGKWKYGQNGNCQFDTLEACKRAAAVIHITDSVLEDKLQEDMQQQLQDQYK